MMSKNNTNNKATNSQQTTPITFIEYPANTKPHEEMLNPFETLEERYLVEDELESSLVEDWMAKNESAENTDAVDYEDMSAEFDKAFGGIDDFNSEDDGVLTEIKTKEIGEWVEIDAVKSPKPKRRGIDLSRKTPLERRANFSGESEATFSLDEAQLSSGNDTETIEALLQDATSDESNDTRLKEDLRKLNQAVEEHKAEIEGLKARQDDYTREIQLLTGEIEAKRKIIAILSIEKESMCKTITDLQYENDQLTVRLADESEKKVTMEKQHADCLESLLEKEQEIRQLRRQLESMEKKRKLFNFRRKNKAPLERATSTMSLDP